MRIAEPMTVSSRMPRGSQVPDFVRRALGLRFEMRFDWETDWWPINAQDIADTLYGYHESLQRCLEALCEGDELASGLAHYRVRR